MFWLTNLRGIRRVQSEGGDAGSGGSGGAGGQSGTGGAGGQGQGGGQSGTGSQNAGAGTGAGAGAAGQESGQQQTFGADYVRDLRRSEAGYRTRATELETRATAAEAEALELKGKLRATAVQAKVTELAPGLKIASANAAFRLLDASKVQFDQEGNPTNVDALLADLVKTETFLVTPAVTTNPTNPGREGAKFTLDEIKKMSATEINANWAEVSKVLEAGS